MAFADPQTVTVDAVEISLPRVGSAINMGSFRSSDQKYQLDIRHQSGTKERHNVKFSFADIVSNPLVPSQNYVVSSTVNMTVEHPRNGMSASSISELAEAVAAWATPTNIGKLIGGEN